MIAREGRVISHARTGPKNDDATTLFAYEYASAHFGTHFMQGTPLWRARLVLRKLESPLGFAGGSHSVLERGKGNRGMSRCISVVQTESEWALRRKNSRTSSSSLLGNNIILE